MLAPVELFVYGTLMRGEANHDQLRGAIFLRTAKTEPRFHLLDLGAYPAMIAGGETAIEGEVHRIEPDQLPALDRFEGAPDLFYRTAVRLEDGSSVEAYIFAQRVTHAGTPIASGSWKRRRIPGTVER